MKKPLLFFALLFIGYSNLFSQIKYYKPFPTIKGQWIVRDGYDLRTGAKHRWKKYDVIGDTAIGAYTYKNVSVANNTGYPTWNGTTYVIPFGTSSFSFAYRNDSINKRVYYLDPTGGLNKDMLWYDFNLKVGDTIQNTFSFSTERSEIQRRIITSIDSTLICGTYHKTFNFRNCVFAGSLIEGIGFNDHFIVTPNYCPFEPTQLFSTSFSNCDITNSIAENDQKSNTVQLYPNPVSSELKIKEAVPFFHYTITNNLGEFILQGNYADKETINVSQISNGIYFISIYDKQGQAYQAKFIKQ